MPGHQPADRAAPEHNRSSVAAGTGSPRAFRGYLQQSRGAQGSRHGRSGYDAYGNSSGDGHPPSTRTPSASILTATHSSRSSSLVTRHDTTQTRFDASDVTPRLGPRDYILRNAATPGSDLMPYLGIHPNLSTTNPDTTTRFAHQDPRTGEIHYSPYSEILDIGGENPQSMNEANIARANAAADRLGHPRPYPGRLAPSTTPLNGYSNSSRREHEASESTYYSSTAPSHSTRRGSRNTNAPDDPGRYIYDSRARNRREAHGSDYYHPGSSYLARHESYHDDQDDSSRRRRRRDQS